MTGNEDLIRCLLVILVVLLPAVTVWVWMVCAPMWAMVDYQEARRREWQRRRAERWAAEHERRRS